MGASAVGRNAVRGLVRKVIRLGDRSDESKIALRRESYRFHRATGLFGLDRLARANASAGAAVDALLRVDNIYVAGRDRFYRAFVDAGAAGDTSFRVDFVSHCC